jgi:hypothetical protein
MGSTDNPYGWVIWVIVMTYVLAFVAWFLVGYFLGGQLTDKAKSVIRKTFDTVDTVVKKEAIKFLKSPNQMKKGN